MNLIKTTVSYEAQKDLQPIFQNTAQYTLKVTVSKLESPRTY